MLSLENSAPNSVQKHFKTHVTTQQTSVFLVIRAKIVPANQKARGFFIQSFFKNIYMHVQYFCGKQTKMDLKNF